MKAILIENGAQQVVETPGRLEDLQKFVGGYIEAAFTVASPEGRSRAITGYVDEEGLIKGKPADFVAINQDGAINVFNGPVIIIGLSERSGKTVGLTDAEIAAITLSAPRTVLSPTLGVLLHVAVVQIDTTRIKRPRKTTTA